MSATTEPAHARKRHSVAHHMRKPYGILAIIGVLFVLAWAAWTFVVW